MSKVSRKQATRNRHIRVRKRLTGTPDRPRLAAASTIDKELKGKLETGANQAAASEVGKLIAKRAKANGIATVVFDRGGNLYHGRVKALAEAAREAGLEF
jgi:large subunit ribosomal protein L18